MDGKGNEVGERVRRAIQAQAAIRAERTIQRWLLDRFYYTVVCVVAGAVILKGLEMFFR